VNGIRWAFEFPKRDVRVVHIVESCLSRDESLVAAPRLPIEKRGRWWEAGVIIVIIWGMELEAIDLLYDASPQEAAG